MKGLLSRRSLIAATAAAGATGARGASRDRPNILWLVSEDNNPYIGAYGDRLARTPTIDRLAARGVLYRNAYSTAPVCAPSRFALITGAYAETCAPAQHMRASAQLPGGWLTTPQFMRQAGYHCTNNAKTDYNCDLDAAVIWDDQGARAHWRSRRPGQPFFSVFNYGTTHESQAFRTTPGRVRAADVRAPGHLPDTPQVREHIASYYNLMERMDGELAARLAELEADGLAEDTLVFYFSDNGGVLPRSKRYCHDAGLRVALVVHAPQRWAHLLPVRPGGEIERAVGLIDLPPTVLALAGASQPEQMQGTPLFGAGEGVRAPRYAFGMRGRMDEVYDLVRTVTDGRWRYIRNYMPHLPAGRHGAYEWQSPAYQSLEAEYLAGRLAPAAERFVQPPPVEELYDLRADPDELTNRAADPQARSELQALRRALDDHMLAVHDNGFIPEGSALEGFAASREPDAYPLPRVMALAALAAQRAPRNLPILLRNLADDNEVVRCWSALGLAMLGDAAAAARGPVEARLMIEPSPQVRVALGSALGASAPDAGADALARLLETEPSQRVKLQVLNALADLGPAALPALEAIRRAGAGGDEYVRSASRYLDLRLTGRYTPTSRIFGASPP